MTSLRCLTHLLISQTVILLVLLFCIYLILLTLVFFLQWLSLVQEILIMLLCQFPLTFHHIHNRMPLIVYDYFCVGWDGLCDHLRDIAWEDIFKFNASAAAGEFFEWVQIPIDIYSSSKVSG